MKKTHRAVFLSCLLMSAGPLSADVADIGPSNSIHPPKSAIPFQPFPLVHPLSGQPVGPHTWFRLPDGTRIQASAYYDKLNDLEKKLNALGHTLRSGDPVQLIGELTDNPKLAAEVKKYDTLIRDFDANYMAYLRNPDLLRQEIEQKLRDEAQRAVDELWAEAKKNFLDSNEIVIQPIDEYMVKKVNNKLYVPWTRDWKFSAGNPGTMSAGAEVSARLGVDSNAYQLIGEAVVKADLLSKHLDLASLGANLEGYEQPKPEAGALPPGNYLDFTLQIVGLSRFTKVYDLGKETFNFKDLVAAAKAKVQLGDLIPKRETPNLGKPLNHFLAGDEHKFRFQIGPIPCSATIGYAGSIGFDTDITSKFAGTKLEKNLDSTVKVPKAVTYSGSLKAGPAIYAEVYGNGAADIEVAKAGFEASVVVLEAGLDVDVGADMSLDTHSFEPQVDLVMSSEYHTLALNGRAAGFAEAYVPVAKVPPWEKKRWEHVIFDWPGYQRRGVLFNVKRHITQHGENISGAPTNDDVKNIAIIEGIKSDLRDVINDLATNTQDKVQAGNELKAANSVATIAYFNWVKTLNSVN